jgi:hypothetical protein
MSVRSRAVPVVRPCMRLSHSFLRHGRVVGAAPTQELAGAEGAQRCRSLIS